MRCIPEIISSGMSVVGLIREDNQDSIHIHDEKCDPAKGLIFGVADGMGGYSLGGLASQMALDLVVGALLERNIPQPEAIKTGIDRANLQVYNTAVQKGVGRMGTTITVAYILGETLHLGHVGDSRAYLVRNGKAECLTVDHTQVGEMVRAKILKPNRIRTHSQRSILTRAVGISLFVKPHITSCRLLPGDRIILCSDGVWSVIEDEEFARVAEQHPVEQVSQVLIDLAMERESDDNASVVAFEIKGFHPASTLTEGIKSPAWLYKLRNMTR